MRKLSLTELGRLSVEEYKRTDKIPVKVLLDNIRSGLNVGSAFRTADAFKIESILLTGITPTPPHREILKTAIGANQSVQWQYEKSVVQAVLPLKSQYDIVMVEQTDKSISLQQWQPNLSKPVVFIFGNEVQGVSEEVIPYADYALEIPQFGTKHSLNISVSIGIVLWNYVKIFLENK